MGKLLILLNLVSYVYVVRSPEVALKCPNVAIIECDMENR